MLPALSGIVSVGAGLGLAELVAAVAAPTGDPLVLVGSLLIDAAPGGAKQTVIHLFGTSDKPALLIAVGVALAIGAAVAGVLEARRRPWGIVLIAAGAIVGVVAGMTRAHADLSSVLPTLVVFAVAAGLLRALINRLPVGPSARADASAASPSRRAFLTWTIGSAAVGVVAAVGGFAAQGGSRVASAARTALRLPKPATTVPAPPAGADFDIPGLAPIITPNADFYRIDTALVVPQIDPADWRLEITGMVDHPVTISWKELLALPLEESWTTLTCVSNEVGGDLIGNARWLGYPIRHLLERASPSASADMVLSTSQDGFTASTPIEALTDPARQAILAVGMNGEPLPPEHGFPVRMVVPGLYGYVSATKWVVKLEVTRYDKATAYWTQEGWSERGPIKLESRIDVVRKQGDRYVVAGVAWHQHVGVAKVELRVDDGDWQPAQLSTPISADTWVQWRYPWDATPGQHTLAVRATGADGQVQTAAVADVLPDGATGYPTKRVSI
jgi:DMSO/TMAO reductase YedYZ molybdopterin-dependent catalytic subunit